MSAWINNEAISKVVIADPVTGEADYLRIYDITIRPGDMDAVDAIRAIPSGLYARKNTAAAHLIKTGPGTLVGFHCAVATGTLTLWDNTSAATTQISGAITLTAGFHQYPVDFAVGLTAVLSGAADVTFIYK